LPTPPNLQSLLLAFEENSTLAELGTKLGKLLLLKSTTRADNTETLSLRKKNLLVVQLCLEAIASTHTASICKNQI
jgi:hypothetical protein